MKEQKSKFAMRPVHMKLWNRKRPRFLVRIVYEAVISYETIHSNKIFSETIS